MGFFMGFVQNLKLWQKLSAALLLIGLLPMVIVTLMSLNSATNSLTSQSFNQLTSIREIKAAAIERHFNASQANIKAFSNNSAVKDASDVFVRSYNNFVLSQGFNQNEIICLVYAEELIPTSIKWKIIFQRIECLRIKKFISGKI